VAFRHHSAKKRKMGKEALEAWLNTLDSWSAIFTLCVVIGVGGELIVHLMQSRANKRLNVLQHSEALAQEAVIARLNKDSADAKASQQEVELDLKKQEERTAKAETNLIELQERIKPRHLSKEQKDTLVGLLSNQQPISPIVFWSMGVPDGEMLGKDFIEVFDKIKWEVTAHNSGTVFPDQQFAGVIIAIHSGDVDVPQAGALQKALEKIGIRAKGSVNPAVPAGTFELRIGVKE
jgi:hypothetical protein